jgi:putative addiction module antidote
MGVARKKIQKIGNSAGVIVPRELLADSGMNAGDEVVMHAEKGRIVITRLDPDFDAMVDAADRFVALHSNALAKLAR